MTQDKAAVLRGIYRREIEVIDQHCTDEAQLIHLGKEQGWAIRGTLHNGAVISVTTANLAETGGSEGYWIDLCAEIDGAPVAFFDEANDSLEHLLGVADSVTAEQVAALREGNRPMRLPEEFELLPHTVVTARSGDRIEISNQGRGREQLLVCDPNGSVHGTYYGFTLPSTELLALVGELSHKLAQRLPAHHRRASRYEHRSAPAPKQNR